MWFYSTIGLATLALVLGVSLFFVVQDNPMAVSEPDEVGLSEPRLLGTWVSDRQRTIESLPGRIDRETESFERLAELFGKMKVIYTASELTFQLDGDLTQYQYTVLGRDKYSCVIKQIGANNGSNKDVEEILQPTTFFVIHFDGPNSYWVHAELGSFAEYFKRLPE